jgi:tetratricopeptide (TPR) repeat protein
MLVGMMLIGVGQYDQAEKQFNKTLEIDPAFGIAYTGLCEIYARREMYDEALAAIERSGNLPAGDYWHQGARAYIYALSGRKPEALEILHELEEAVVEGGTHAAAIGSIYAALGENEQALVWLEKICETRSSQILFLVTDSALDGLRSDPRFIAMLKKIGVRK